LNQFELYLERLNEAQEQLIYTTDYLQQTSAPFLVLSYIGSPNDNMKPTSNKKRIHGSPQKMQTSIVSCLTNQKKQNTNITPPRTAVVLANNPYRLLADNTDPDENEETILTSLEPYLSPQTLQTSIVSHSNHKKLNSNPSLSRTALDRAS
jgi:hypothetical protein